MIYIYNLVLDGPVRADLPWAAGAGRAWGGIVKIFPCVLEKPRVRFSQKLAGSFYLS